MGEGRGLIKKLVRNSQGMLEIEMNLSLKILGEELVGVWEWTEFV